MPPQALIFPFEPVKDLGDYWCEVAVRNVVCIFLLFFVYFYFLFSASKDCFMRQMTFIFKLQDLILNTL